MRLDTAVLPWFLWTCSFQCHFNSPRSINRNQHRLKDYNCRVIKETHTARVCGFDTHSTGGPQLNYYGDGAGEGWNRAGEGGECGWGERWWGWWGRAGYFSSDMCPCDVSFWTISQCWHDIWIIHIYVQLPIGGQTLKGIYILYQHTDKLLAYRLANLKLFYLIWPWFWATVIFDLIIGYFIHMWFSMSGQYIHLAHGGILYIYM